jgi:hypothetical protein
MMNWINGYFARSRARMEGLLDMDGREGYLTETFGVGPSTLAKSSLEYRESVEALAARSRRTDIEEELLRLRELQSAIGTPEGYTLGLVGLTIIETWGMVTLLQSFDGVSATERPYLAVGLSIGLIQLTKAVAEATSRPTRRRSPPAAGSAPAPTTLPRGPTTPDEGVPQALDIPWRAIVLIAAYTVFVAGIVVLRVTGHASGDEGVTAQALAEGVATVVTTIGPAWFAARVAAKRAPAKQLAKRIALVVRKLRVAERQERNARRYLTELDRAQASHVDARARTEAAFERERERTVALRKEGLVDASELEGQ